jgi:hypothetical protein
MKYGEKEYQAIVDVNVEGNKLIVTFENGDIGTLTLNSSTNEPIEVNDMIYNRYEIRVNETTVIPWSQVRYLTDPEYKKYHDDLTSVQSRKIGAKLKQFREEAGMSIDEMCFHLKGISPDKLEQVESGENGPIDNFALLKNILAITNHQLKDLGANEA